MFKNTSSQFVTLLVIDASTGLQKAGDAANLVFYVSKDDGLVVAITSNSGVPSEIDATNAKGSYKIALAQAESNGDKLLFTGKSSTANVVVVPQTIYTVPANFTATAIDGSGKLLLQATQTGVTIPTVTTVTNQLTAAAIATGVWQDATAGDFTVASSIGKSLYIANVAPGAAGGHLISGSNAGTTTFAALTVTGATTMTGGLTANITGNLSGSVGSVTGNVGGNVVGSVASVVAVVAANVTQWTGNAVATTSVNGVPKVDMAYTAGVAVTGFDGLIQAAATSGATTIKLASTESASSPAGAILFLQEGTSRQVVQVTAYTAGTQTATITPALAFNLTTSSQYSYIGGAYSDVRLWLGSAPNALVAGRVDASAGAVADKAGYSLTQAFPSNFASLAIDPSGNVSLLGPLRGTAVAGSTGTAVIVSGLPSGKSYVGSAGVGAQKLYHPASGEARIILSQSFSSPNYTFTLNSGTTSGEAGSFSAAPTAGDALFICP